MRVTHVLWKQHLGRMIKGCWNKRSKKTILPTTTEDYLVSKGFQVIDAKHVIRPPRAPKKTYVNVDWPFKKPPPMDSNHPEWNEKPCLEYGDKSLLLEGISQAQILLNTVVIEKLPEKINALEKEEPKMEIQNLIERSIYASHIFDAWQEKLPKVINAQRPQINMPRVYGIPDARKLHNLLQKLFQICELVSDPIIGHQRKVLEDAHLRTFIERDNDLLYFESIFDLMIASPKPLTPIIMGNDYQDTTLPDLYPLDPAIGLKPKNIYTGKDHYPILEESRWVNPHTIVVNYEKEKTKNITELPVTENQMIARSMMKSFATAACSAKQKFGEEVVDLPEPVIVQCIQSNGQWFDFSIFQLNTLDIANSKNGKKNLWWIEPRIELFHKAEYIKGRPEVQGYNPEVFKKILAFYRNV